ncbi:hypothetical protein FALBO_7037 [Fusarium albosuccineum]|uniref:Protein kinase domain-containing protein n=1 Tax=Fusarium albosuccineum TaxID=1237068 RepID=A0A8H4LC62_9HYPO|nr:hypothetical protein FALBO_7037 [Fusarium albosuccineum]
MSPSGNFIVGQTLTLSVRSGHPSTVPSTIHVRIQQLHTRTPSCTMVVNTLEPLEKGSASEADKPCFLKLFDRRFSEQLRSHNGIDPWTQVMKDACIESVKNDAIHEFLHNLHHVPNFQDDTEEDWDDAQNEAFLADELRRLYETENERQDFEPFKIKGLLLQYIKGSNLWDMVDHFPQSSWQDIVDQAVGTVHLLGHHNILNQDVRPENFMVSTRAEAGQTYGQVFMIDFALCRFRGQNESESEWGRDKHTRDETGAVGLRMKKFLGERGFDLKSERSRRYAQWANRDMPSRDGAIRTELGPGVFWYTRPPVEKQS